VAAWRHPFSGIRRGAPRLDTTAGIEARPLVLGRALAGRSGTATADRRDAALLNRLLLPDLLSVQHSVARTSVRRIDSYAEPRGRWVADN